MNIIKERGVDSHYHPDPASEELVACEAQCGVVRGITDERWMRYGDMVFCSEACAEVWKGENNNVCIYPGCFELKYEESPYCETHTGDY